MRGGRRLVAVIGSGFSGSMMAAAARSAGLDVVLLERGRHPRFAIGESTTPLTNLLVEEIADEFGMPRLRPLSKWGTWQRANPALACGIKRGFTFYKHDLGRKFPRAARESLRRQLMVGASPNEEVADTHWYRPDLDEFLVRHAQEAGVDYRDGAEVDGVDEKAGHVRISGRRHGRAFAISADFVVDASGPRGCLHRLLRLPERGAAGFPATQALYAHFRDVGPLDRRFAPGAPPYPNEQAAVHHVFDGGWLWVLRFNNGVTSAGVVATQAAARRLRLRPGEEGWRNVLAALPSVAGSFREARAVTAIHWQPRVAFQSGRVVGRRWALLPSAAGVVDPLLSTGFPLALLGVQRLARLLPELGKGGFTRGLAQYGGITMREFLRTAELVKALYGTMPRFDDFRELSLAYFAAAGFSEASRRLGRPSQAPGFLLGSHRWFGPRLRGLCAPGLRGGPLRTAVREAIAPIDVLGLSDDSRSPWYPARTRDLFLGARKLRATQADIAAMLERCGLSGGQGPG
jgi:FADH2 O2-dependent halogenase